MLSFSGNMELHNNRDEILLRSVSCTFLTNFPDPKIGFWDLYSWGGIREILGPVMKDMAKIGIFDPRVSGKKTF